jgi:hypothetical protein
VRFKDNLCKIIITIFILLKDGAKYMLKLIKILMKEKQKMLPHQNDWLISILTDKMYTDCDIYLLMWNLFI